jgi:non-homologous end joining protein Ku
VIKRKQKGEDVHIVPAEEEEAPTDLMEALRASMDAVQKSRARRPATRPKARRRTTAKAR